MQPVKCQTCFQPNKILYEVIKSKEKDSISFCSRECYNIFITNVLKTKEGAKDLVSKRKFRILKHVRIRDDSPDSPEPTETPKNTPEAPKAPRAEEKDKQFIFPK